MSCGSISQFFGIDRLGRKDHAEEDGEFVPEIGVAWATIIVILLSSAFLNKIFGKRGIIACKRLVGLLLTTMFTQMFLEGLA
jgi:small neutral amino acid transporter SnatA (MarC family)